jgi:hypothetical protein
MKLEPNGRHMASARDHYFDSERGKNLSEPSILKDPFLTECLQNRLEEAFLDGYRIGFSDSQTPESEAAE